MEDKEVLVKVEGLSKKFCKDLKTSLKYGVQDLFSNVRGNRNERLLRDKEFWAVKDVSFELRRGECLGLIGHNGAGKSTLLKILNGLIKPDAGKVTIKGRVGALIELGAGFNPILTGRENIFNNGAVLGFSRKEIGEKLEEIIDFAEIREFIDMPVQNFSSGMKVRLGFAVAAQMEPDVLIIDEVLAVGDVAFRMKCYNTITALLPKTAIIFVSHSMPQVSKISTSALLLRRGEVKSYSHNISNVINKYFIDTPTERKSVVTGNGKAKVLSKKLVHQAQADVRDEILIKKGNIIKLFLEMEIDSSVYEYGIRLIIYDNELKGIMEVNSLNEGIVFENGGNVQKLELEFTNPLNHGNYLITLIVIEVLKDGRIGERLLRQEGLFDFKSLNTQNGYESYIPISVSSSWNKIK
ncbi:polysaccharide ABC transporter ATP-binding protein [Christiangramia echinicola]|uniref:Lipopolysaccharide transport system ATP-binding protein n=1 Tax=Christiangramia echinicola TaxID=279359 RepID=A0A1H1L5R4_9FLAO|nr:ABC transporter ATP-binding protein [Christiangramia echinicola]SDR69259.1 lipopolysaccharide transport system ATP-binding protein [Christiangramia echinicola]